MTTIAWDGKTLATDSQVTLGDVIIDNHARKIWRNLCGFKAVAACGDWGRVQDLVLLMEKLTAKDLLKTRPGFSEVSLVGLTKEGRLFEYQWNKLGEVYQCETTCPSAWGSGFSFALSAMDFGKTAKEAIKFASTRDLYTNSLVQSVRT